MDPTQINYFAVAVAALSSFLVGGLWYSPVLFSKAWTGLVGLTDEELKQGSMLKIFGGSFALALVMSLNLAFFLGPNASITFGVCAGLAGGIGWIAASMGITYLFERRPLKLFAINAGYHVVAFTMMGLILAALSGPANAEAKAEDPQMRTYYLVMLTRGPSWTAEQTPELSQLQKAHLAHLDSMHHDGKLLVAGPIVGGDDYAGVVVFGVESREAAETLVKADPAVQAGRLGYRILPWMSEVGLRSGPGA